jgi:proteasome regulatory subunit
MFAIREGRDKVLVSDFMDAVEKIMGAEKEEDYSKEAGVMFG